MDEERFGKTVATLLEKLAGKESDLELKFKDLTVEVAGAKVKLTGCVILSLIYVKEAEK
jgi:hypothetical protein